jgi:hypothetical protein
MKKRNWQRAKDNALAALVLDPAHHQAKVFSSRAETKIIQVQKEITAARQALEKRHWRKALEHAQHVLQLEPSNEAAKAIQTVAYTELRRIRKKRPAISVLARNSRS